MIIKLTTNNDAFHYYLIPSLQINICMYKLGDIFTPNLFNSPDVQTPKSEVKARPNLKQKVVVMSKQ